MRIAQIAPVGLRVPPKKYGGTERVVSVLTEELVRRGHEVTLFASGDSITGAKLISHCRQSLLDLHFENPFSPAPLALLNIGMAYQMQDSFDIIHDHNNFLSLPTAANARTPVVMTIHEAFSLRNRKIYELLNTPYFVTISESQRRPIPQLHAISTVYHGLPMETYPFSNETDDYLLYVGRIAEEKGTHYAVSVAEYLDMPLLIAAKVDPCDRSYFEKEIQPRLNQKIRWIGEVSEEERNKLMSRAYAFLHPVTWREPFGLTLIEAMACGCPVIAFQRGSIPEIIVEGKTGFIVEDVTEMISAVSRIPQIKRRDCRNHVLEKFNVKNMTDGYEAIYEKILTDYHQGEKRNHSIKKLSNGFMHTKRLELAE